MSPSFVEQSYKIIPSHGQETIEDPRVVHRECSELIERRKRFLGQKTVPHHLQKHAGGSAATTSNSALILFHESNHNYDMLSYSTEMKFFSFMDDKYDALLRHLDPRRNKESDLLGSRLFCKQAFIDPTMEISTTDGLEIQKTDLPSFQDIKIEDLKLLTLDTVTEEMPSNFTVCSKQEIKTGNIEPGPSAVNVKRRKLTKNAVHVSPEINSFVEETMDNNNSPVGVRRSWKPLQRLSPIPTDPNGSFLQEVIRETANPNFCSTPILDKASCTQRASRNKFTPRKRDGGPDLLKSSKRPNLELKTPSKPIRSPLSTALETKRKYRETKLSMVNSCDHELLNNLSKFCRCWIEECKHAKCTDNYSDFLISITTRFGGLLDMEVIVGALKTLKRSDSVDYRSNFFLCGSIFTSEVLKLLNKESNVSN